MKIKTIKDLFIEQKSYIVEYKLNDKYYLFIEALSENGCTLTRKFDKLYMWRKNKTKLENNILVELHSYDFDDSICEWYNCSKFDIDKTLENLKEIMQYAIDQYESEQE